MLRQMLKHNIQPMRLVHALQNHDELMLETTHLRTYAQQAFEYEGHHKKGAELFHQISTSVLEKVAGESIHYNHPFAMSPGVCSTLAGFIAAALGIENLDDISREQIEQIKRIHLLAAAFNALQGGVFALSGWDLVGALPLPADSVKALMDDNDHRWLNRGGYDLMGQAEEEDFSIQGLPKARAIYGDLPAQLQDQNSFASLLQSMFALRATLGIAKSELILVPPVSSEQVVILVNKLDAADTIAQSWQITALNFGEAAIRQQVEYAGFSGEARALWSSHSGEISQQLSLNAGSLAIDLSPFEAQLLLISEGRKETPNNL